MKKFSDTIIFSEDVIRRRVKELAREISRDYDNKELHLLAILRGAFLFLADLSRELTNQAVIDFMVVEKVRRGGGDEEIRIIKDLDVPLEGKDVLLVEDIIDEGKTLHYVLEALKLRNPATLKIVTLFDRPGRRQSTVRPDYNGFVVPDRFVVGYGLDHGQRYRNLPYLASLPRDLMDAGNA
jgi:hypoxanthine phosphoribosyltransferase